MNFGFEGQVKITCPHSFNALFCQESSKRKDFYSNLDKIISNRYIYG